MGKLGLGKILIKVYLNQEHSYPSVNKITFGIVAYGWF